MVKAQKVRQHQDGAMTRHPIKQHNLVDALRAQQARN